MFANRNRLSPCITRATGVKSLGQAEAEVAALKAEARNKLSTDMIEYDLNLARINIIPKALAEAGAATLARAGIEATIANSRGPESLKDLVRELGPSIKAGTREEAARVLEAARLDDQGLLPELLVERPDLPPPEPLAESWQRRGQTCPDGAM